MCFAKCESCSLVCKDLTFESGLFLLNLGPAEGQAGIPGLKDSPTNCWMGLIPPPLQIQGGLGLQSIYARGARHTENAHWSVGIRGKVLSFGSGPPSCPAPALTSPFPFLLSIPCLNKQQ